MYSFPVPICKPIRNYRAKLFRGYADIGYNVNFDFNFLTDAISKLGQDNLNNKVKDIMPVVKKDNMFLDNYQLETVLKE